MDHLGINIGAFQGRTWDYEMWRKGLNTSMREMGYLWEDEPGLSLEAFSGLLNLIFPQLHTHSLLRQCILGLLRRFLGICNVADNENTSTQLE